jgi:predicted small integral membrane protein
MEETGGVESGGELKSFVMKIETTRGGLLFIGSKLSAVVLNYTRYR